MKILFNCVHPCPCGYYGDSQKPCTCAAPVVTKYQKRISGPLLDRIDIHIEVLRGTALQESGTMLHAPSQSGQHEIYVWAEYNAVNDPDLSGVVSWTPWLFVDMMETQDVKPAVESGAGPFNW